MATMKDVAQLAGVSTATVSRALMNPEKVSSSTRKRVEDAVLEAGYSPNSLARNLRRNESKTIVTIVPDICDPYFSEIIRGIEDAAMEHGYLSCWAIADNRRNAKALSLTSYLLSRQMECYCLVQIYHSMSVSQSKRTYLRW